MLHGCNCIPIDIHHFMLTVSPVCSFSIYFWKELTCFSSQQLLCVSAFIKGLQKVIFVSFISEEFGPIPSYKQYQPLSACRVMSISLRTTTCMHKSKYKLKCDVIKLPGSFNKGFSKLLASPKKSLKIKTNKKLVTG